MARCSTIASPPSSSTIADTNVALSASLTDNVKVSRAGTVMSCETGAAWSDPSKVTCPCLGVEVGFATTISPPTVSSPAGMPGQYHVVVMGARCDANGRFTNGAAPNRAGAEVASSRPKMIVLNRPTVRTDETKILRWFTMLLRRRRDRPRVLQRWTQALLVEDR